MFSAGQEARGFSGGSHDTVCQAAVCSKPHAMFEASRLHSLSEAGVHKRFFPSLVPLFAVEAVSRPVLWKGYGILRPYLAVYFG